MQSDLFILVLAHSTTKENIVVARNRTDNPRKIYIIHRHVTACCCTIIIDCFGCLVDIWSGLVTSASMQPLVVVIIFLIIIRKMLQQERINSYNLINYSC